MLILSAAMLVLSTRGWAEMATAVSDIEVTLEKKVFRVGDKLEGRIDVFNKYPAAIPIILKIKLQHENTDVFDSLLGIKIFPGSNEYSLGIFNIPPLFNRPDAVGRWQLLVGERVGDSYRTAVEFRVKN